MRVSEHLWSYKALFSKLQTTERLHGFGNFYSKNWHAFIVVKKNFIKFDSLNLNLIQSRHDCTTAVNNAAKITTAFEISAW